jgi:Uma2 family endonuclease
MVATTRMSLDEFLALEETKPYLELVDGEVIPKMAPTRAHGRLVARLTAALESYLSETGEGEVHTEVRHVSRDEERVYLPDISVTLAGRLPADEGLGGPEELAPDFTIAVLSPDDQAGRVLERVEFYLRIGVRLIWLVDPERRTVTVYRPGEPLAVYRPPASLDATPVLRNFSLSLENLFDALRRPGH